MLEAARRLAEAGDAGVDVVAVAAVQEEVGGGGARAAAFALEADVALVVDVTWSTDVPGASARRAGKVELGSGAAITRGPVVNPRVAALLLAAAAAEAIPHCVEVYARLDPDRRRRDPRGAGRRPDRARLDPASATCTRPASSASLDDLEAVVQLLVAFARRLGPEISLPALASDSWPAA